MQRVIIVEYFARFICAYLATHMEFSIPFVYIINDLCQLSYPPPSTLFTHLFTSHAGLIPFYRFTLCFLQTSSIDFLQTENSTYSLP